MKWNRSCNRQKVCHITNSSLSLTRFGKSINNVRALNWFNIWIEIYIIFLKFIIFKSFLFFSYKWRISFDNHSSLQWHEHLPTISCYASSKSPLSHPKLKNYIIISKRIILPLRTQQWDQHFYHHHHFSDLPKQFHRQLTHQIFVGVLVVSVQNVVPHHENSAGPFCDLKE